MHFFGGPKSENNLKTHTGSSSGSFSYYFRGLRKNDELVVIGDINHNKSCLQ